MIYREIASAEYSSLANPKYRLCRYPTRICFLAASVISATTILMFYTSLDCTVFYKFRWSRRESDMSGSGLYKGYFLEACNCTKHKNRSRYENSADANSTCSDEADWYGPGQNVVTFTLLEDKDTNDPGDKFEVFVEGIVSNLKQVQLYYRGYIIRIYTDHDLDKQLCVYACRDELMWCDIRQPRMGVNMVSVNFRVWRFMVIGDPMVDIFLSRDLDSYICERERDVTVVFLASDFIFYCSRDVPHHDADMWAGAWGGKNHMLDSTESANLRKEFMKRATNNNTSRLDEYLLSELVYTKYPNNLLAFDAFRCKNPKHKAVPAVPFPTQRLGRRIRIAMNIRNLGEEIAEECPVDCRPPYGLNWTYC